MDSSLLTLFSLAGQQLCGGMTLVTDNCSITSSFSNSNGDSIERIKITLYKQKVRLLVEAENLAMYG